MNSISSSSGFSSFIDPYTSYDSADSRVSNRSTLSSTTPSSDVASTAISLPSTTSDSLLGPSLPSISLETYGFSDSSIGSELSKLPNFWETVDSSTDSFSFISSDNCSVLDNSDVPSPLSDPFLDNFSSSHMPTLPSTPISARSPTPLSSAVVSTPSPSPTTSSDVSNPSLSSSSSSKLQLCTSTERCPYSEFFGVADFTSESIGIETNRLRLIDSGSFKSPINQHGYRNFYISDAPNRRSIILFKTRSLAEQFSKQRSDLHPYLSPFGPGIDPIKELFEYCRRCQKVQLVYRGFASKNKDGCCSWKKANKQTNKKFKEKAVIQAKLLSSTSSSTISHPASALSSPSVAASSTTSSIISTSTTISSTISSSEESSIPSPSPSTTSSDVSNPSLSSSSSSKLQSFTSIKNCPPSKFFGVANFTSELMAVEMDRLRLIDDPLRFKSHILQHGYRDFYISDAPNRRSLILFKTRSLAEEVSKQRSDLYPYLSPFGPGIDPTKEMFKYCKACKKVQLVYRGFASKNKDGCCSWTRVNSQVKKENLGIIQAQFLSSTSSSAISHPASALSSPSMTVSSMSATSTTTPSFSIISPSTTSSSIASSSEKSSTSSTLPSTTSISKTVAYPSNEFTFSTTSQAVFPCALEVLQATTPTAIPNASLTNINTSELRLRRVNRQCPPSEFFGVVNFTSKLMAIEMDRLRLIDDPGSFKSQIKKFGHKYFYISDAPNGRSIILFKTRQLAEEFSNQRSDLHPYLSPFEPGIDPTKEQFAYCKVCKKVQLVYRGFASKVNDGCCSWKKANRQANKKSTEKAVIQAKHLSSTFPSAISHSASALLSSPMPASSMAAPSTTPSSSISSLSTTLSSTALSSEESLTSSTLPSTTSISKTVAYPSNEFTFSNTSQAVSPRALEVLQATTPTAIPNTPLPNINTDSTTLSSSSSTAVASVASSKKRRISSGLAHKKARLNSGKTILKSHRPS